MTTKETGDDLMTYYSGSTEDLLKYRCIYDIGSNNTPTKSLNVRTHINKHMPNSYAHTYTNTNQ